MRQSWTKKKVREAILGLRKAKKPIHLSSIRKSHPSLLQAGCYHYGSWKRAVQGAGIRYSDVVVKPLEMPPKLVLAKIREIYRLRGTIAPGVVAKEFQYVHSRARKCFGSWRKAIEAAGFSYANICAVRPHRHWSKKSIIAEFKRRQIKGLPLNQSLVRKEDGGLCFAVLKYFGKGGWDKVLRKLGLSTKAVFPRHWSQELVIAKIVERNQLGLSLDTASLVKNGLQCLYLAGVRCFGSWEKAVTVAGINYSDVLQLTRWTPSLVLKEIRRLKKSGVRLTLKVIQKERSDLLRAAQKLFDGWDRAVEAAGIDYRKHTLIWSTKAWIRKLRAEDVKKLSRKADTLARRRRK